MTTGSRTTTTRMRETSGLMCAAYSSGAESSAAARILLDRGLQARLAEVGPERLVEDELRVGRLPEQEVRDSLLARRADHEVGIAQLRRVQARRERVLGDVLGTETLGDEASSGVHELRTPAV